MADRYSMPSIRGDDPVQTFQLQSALMRRRQPSTREQFAKALMQQGASTAPVSSWVEGLARALQGTVGGYMAGEAEREGKAADQEMIADMLGRSEQRKADEAAQLAQAGVPGFKMPMPNPEPGVAYAQPTAPAGGGAEVVPPNMLQPAPQPAARPVNADMIAALSGMAGQGNKTAAGALPGFKFQYEDAYNRERDARRDAMEERRLAQSNQESFGQPTTLDGPDGKPVLVQIGNRGTIRPVQGGYQAPPAAPGGAFGGSSVEAQALNVLLAPNADPTSPVYGAAFQKLYGPRMVQQPDGTVITMQPQPPAGIRPPVAMGGGSPQNPASPPSPADGGAPSTTLQTPGGTVTRTGGDVQKLSPTEIKLKEETETAIQGLQSTRTLLDQAMKLSRDAYAGPLATQRGAAAGLTGFDSKTAEATQRFQTIMGTQALERLKEIFGGNPTEGERKILLDMQASATMSRVQREALLRDALDAVARREPFLKQRLNEITAGRYGRIGAQTPMGTPSAAPVMKFDRMGNPINGD